MLSYVWRVVSGERRYLPPNRGVDFYCRFLPAKIEGSISILNFFPPNRGDDFYVRPSRRMLSHWHRSIGAAARPLQLLTFTYHHEDHEHEPP
jgi:hypothetical protein